LLDAIKPGFSRRLKTAVTVSPLRMAKLVILSDFSPLTSNSYASMRRVVTDISTDRGGLYAAPPEKRSLKPA
jgi:hypothetical protein